jgi:hypothetical protein
MDAHKNFAYSAVLTAPSPATSGTSLAVAVGAGANFPAVPFNATVWPAASQPTLANAEIVRVTAISGDMLTIQRAQEGSSARTIIVGDQIAATITAKTLTDVEGAITSEAAARAAADTTVLATAEGYTDAVVAGLPSAYQLLALADAAALRSGAGLVIGTDVEAHDSDLTTIAGLTPTNDDVVQRKAGAWSNRTMAQLIADLAALGTTFQPLDSDLSSMAALSTTSYGRNLLTLANAAAADWIPNSALDTDGTLAANSDVRVATQKAVKTYVDTNPSNVTQSLDTTSQSTASSTYTDLGDGPNATVTVTVTSSGLLLVGFACSIGGANGFCSVALSGTNAIAASDNWALSGFAGQAGRSYLFTGLTAGSQTVTMKYRSSSGSIAFANRNLWALAF